MKKIFKLLVVIALFLCVNVNAETLTINNAYMNEEEKYKIYTMMDYTGYGYVVIDEWVDFFTTGYGANVVTLEEHSNMFINLKEEYDVELFAKTAKEYIESKDVVNYAYEATYDSYDSNTNAVNVELNQGYYLVVSPRGNKPAIVFINEDVEINEKNTFISKMEIFASKNAENIKVISSEYGKPVNFVVKADLNNGLNKALFKLFGEIIIDQESISIDGVNSEYYTVNYDKNDDTLSLEFSKEYLDSIEENVSLEIKFNGKVSNKYSISQPLILEYTINQAVKSDRVIVQTWKSKIHTFVYDDEHTSKDSIRYVTYTLSRDKDGKDLIEFVDLYDSGYEYRVATENDTNTTTVLSQNGAAFYIIGLSDETYYLHQTYLEFGYAKITTPIEFKVSLKLEEGGIYDYKDDIFEVEVQKINAVMPFTGGTGTTMLVTLGLIIFITSLGLIVTKLKNEN